MHSSAERAVERAIEKMHTNLSEQLTIDDLARAAMFSKFHFTRVFQRVTGISPGRFLSALRLQEAKRLLLATRLNVADISVRVGYNSVGTFSTRFTRSVGLSPTTYRRMGGHASQVSPSPSPPSARAAVEGVVHTHPEAVEPSAMFLGLFPDRIPEGPPIRCTVLDRPGAFRFTSVPDGTWYLLGHSVSEEEDIMGLRQDGVLVGTVGPLHVRGTHGAPTNIHLKPVSKLDPPVLLALLDARKAALDRLHGAAMAA